MSQQAALYPPRKRKNADRQAVNVTINKALIAKSKSLGINLSALFEEALMTHIAQLERRAWLEDNGDAIAEYNERVDDQGCFSDKLRSF